MMRRYRKLEIISGNESNREEKIKKRWYNLN
jgi:hypothetical protein